MNVSKVDRSAPLVAGLIVVTMILVVLGAVAHKLVSEFGVLLSTGGQ